MQKIYILLIITVLTVSCKEKSSSTLKSPTTEIQEKTEKLNDTLSDLLRVEYPVPGQLISSPLEITGTARGYWFFEAEAMAELLDENMNKISMTNTTAVGEWMTEDWVPFSGTMVFENPTTKNGYLVLHKANASGLKEHEMSDTIQVKFRS